MSSLHRLQLPGRGPGRPPDARGGEAGPQDRSRPGARPVLELKILPGDAVVGDDQLADAIASNLASYGHPTGTAPMGGLQDPWAVVDSRGAVKSVDALRVIDASIMPVVPSVALNPTTIMIAERMAATVYAREPGPTDRVGISQRDSQRPEGTT